MTAPPLARGLVFATEALEPLADVSRAAEAAGFAGIWTTEYPGRDAAARALYIALNTSSIRVGTGIAYAFTRKPLAMAGLAADLRRLSGGRFALGLGTGSKGVRRWYGATEFEPPARAFAAYAEELKERFGTMGELAEHGPPPVYGAGLMPVMTRTAVHASDGVLLHPLALIRTHLHERVVPAIAAGNETRDSRAFSAMWCITSIANDEETARENAKRQIAFYLSTPSYGGVVEGTSWAAVADVIRDTFAQSRPRPAWSELSHLVPDSLVDEIALAGPAAAVVEQSAKLEHELAELGFDEIVYQTVGAGLSDDDVVDNCRAIVAALGPAPVSGR